MSLKILIQLQFIIDFRSLEAIFVNDLMLSGMKFIGESVLDSKDQSDIWYCWLVCWLVETLVPVESPGSCGNDTKSV